MRGPHELCAHYIGASSGGKLMRDAWMTGLCPRAWGSGEGSARMSLARDITTVGSGTLVSRLLAYVRDAWIAALLGAGPYSETLFAVLQVVNFFRRLLSEGALNSAFVPIWTKPRGGAAGAANAQRLQRPALLME